MKHKINPISAADLEFSFFGNAYFKADYIAGLDNADNTCITFYKGDDIKRLSAIEVGILLVKKGIEGKINKSKSEAIIFCENPKYEFVKILSANYQTSFEAHSRQLKFDGTVTISPLANIESNVQIGSNSQIYPFVSVFNDSSIGENCRIQSGTVIGASGQGDVMHNGKYYDFIHLGNVTIGDDVTIGTNCSIMKGLLETTEIGEGTRIANNVNIGHNCKIGKNCYISSGATIGGACIIEDNCWISIGAVLTDHVKIEKNTKIGAGSVVIKDALADSFYLGNPARRLSERVD